jgi:hypothetical protein
MTAAHHLFELGAGTGLVFQPYVGLARAVGLWGSALPAWWVVARRGSHRWDGPLAFAAGLSVGGTAVHFSLWRWEVRRGVPVLVEAEGLRPDQLPAYNALLYAWGLSGLAALIADTPKRARPWAMAGMLASLPLRMSARHHFQWIKVQARERPAWWNRALRDVP